MTRRTTLKLLPLAGVTLSTLCGDTSSVPPLDYLPNDWNTPKFEYRGLVIEWSGWKPGQGNFVLAGQWIAYGGPKGPYMFAQIPGKAKGVFQLGDQFPAPAFERSDVKETMSFQGRLKLIERGRQEIMALVDGFLNEIKNG